VVSTGQFFSMADSIHPKGLKFRTVLLVEEVVSLNSSSGSKLLLLSGSGLKTIILFERVD